MKIHRFYIGDKFELKHDFWIHDKELINQWSRVLRFRGGQKIVLFDGERTDRLYEITEINNDEAHVKLVTDLNRKFPAVEVYLFWSLLKKDKNEWVIQKGTELGVSNFVPIISERCDRNEVSSSRVDRWRKIAIEASEQSGRSDIPFIREPIKLSKAIDEYKDKIVLIVANEDGNLSKEYDSDKIGVFVGPEGGWSNEELEIFDTNIIKKIKISDFTLRAETAAVTVIGKLLK